MSATTPHRILSERQIRERAQSDERIISEPNCLKCAHLPICAVYRAIAPLLQSFQTQDGDDRAVPFKPEELAKLCKFYAPPNVAFTELE